MCDEQPVDTNLDALIAEPAQEVAAPEAPPEFVPVEQPVEPVEAHEEAEVQMQMSQPTPGRDDANGAILVEEVVDTTPVPAQTQGIPQDHGRKQRMITKKPIQKQQRKIVPKKSKKAKKVVKKKPDLTLHGYWRSGATWRVRLALALKGFHFGKEVEYVPVNLVSGEQDSEQYAKLNPAGLVPTLTVKDKAVVKKPVTLSESLPICEWLEEVYPNKRKLLPKDPLKRQEVRRMCEMINAGTQPVQNLGILKEIGARFGDEHKAPWGAFAINRGLSQFERFVAKGSGKYCQGNIITLADVFLVSITANAARFGVDMEQYPRTASIIGNLNQISEFKNAHPDMQPDAVKQ